MCSDVIVIGDVDSKDSAQVRLAEDDDVIEAVYTANLIRAGMSD